MALIDFMFWSKRTTTAGGGGGGRGRRPRRGQKRGERPQKSAADLDAEMEVRVYFFHVLTQMTEFHVYRTTLHRMRLQPPHLLRLLLN